MFYINMNTSHLTVIWHVEDLTEFQTYLCVFVCLLLNEINK